MRWGEERYNSLSHYVKNTYNEKLYKIALDGGFTCPNRDGFVGSGGCIFCSEEGSGDFTASHILSINEQLTQGKHFIQHKVKTPAYIAYFQAYTNTYAPVSELREKFMTAIHDPEVKVLSIATRPDCLGGDIISLLNELNQIKPVWVELGLQSSNEITGTYINRCYDLSVFETGLEALRAINIDVIVHTIIGLPSEQPDGILDTIHYLNSKDIQGIKLQLLHVLKGTAMEEIYNSTPFFVPTMDEYISLLGECINTLRGDIIVHRLTGDGPKDLLLVPLWSGNKKIVLNKIRKYFKEADIWQGKYYNTQEKS